MKVLLLVLGGLVVLVGLVALVGALLPRAHVATRMATYARQPADLHAVVRDVAAAPAWRSDLKAVELLPPRDGRPAWRETTGHGAIAFVVLEEKPGERRVTKIADDALPFGGTWTFEFAPAGSGGSLRITEHGQVKNVIFRFLARFVFGHTRTMETYLRDLGRKFGETVEVRP
jgi:hypothetical protein